jgi:hypothetical protein
MDRKYLIDAIERAEKDGDFWKASELTRILIESTDWGVHNEK